MKQKTTFLHTCIYPLYYFKYNMENECLLDMNNETISPPSSLKDQSLNSFSHNLTGRLGIVNLGTETVIHETKT